MTHGERCRIEGHSWSPLDDVGDQCRWCGAIAAVDDRAPGDEELPAVAYGHRIGRYTKCAPATVCGGPGAWAQRDLTPSAAPSVMPPSASRAYQGEGFMPAVTLSQFEGKVVRDALVQELYDMANAVAEEDLKHEPFGASEIAIADSAWKVTRMTAVIGALTKLGFLDERDNDA